MAVKPKGRWFRAYFSLHQSKHFEKPRERMWFLYMLSCCAWREDQVFRHKATGVAYTLQPGQFARSLHKFADEELGVPHTTFQRFLQRLESEGVIKIESGQPGGLSGGQPPSIITIRNWKAYQQPINGDGLPVGQPLGQPYKESMEEEDSLRDSPPIPPKGGEGGGKKRKPKPLVPTYTAEFQTWWDAYPRRHGVKVGNKPRSFELYRKLRAHFSAEILTAAAAAYAKHENGKAEKDRRIMDPDRFLKGEVQAWMDNVREAAARKQRPREELRSASGKRIV